MAYTTWHKLDLTSPPPNKFDSILKKYQNICFSKEKRINVLCLVVSTTYCLKGHRIYYNIFTYILIIIQFSCFHYVFSTQFLRIPVSSLFQVIIKYRIFISYKLLVVMFFSIRKCALHVSGYYFFKVPPPNGNRKCHPCVK